METHEQSCGDSWSGFPADVGSMGFMQLPPLPYLPDALSPDVAGHVIQTHYGSVHGSWVDRLNVTLAAIRSARQRGDNQALTVQMRLAEHQNSMHRLHTAFWCSMTPGGCDVPSDLADALAKSFGSLSLLRWRIIRAVAGIPREKRGWVMLAHEPACRSMRVVATGEMPNVTRWALVPLLVCDVWEEAYQAQYGADRQAWAEAFLRVANWDRAAGLWRGTGEAPPASGP